MKIIGKTVKLKRCIMTGERHWALGTKMKVHGRMADGTYTLLKPGGAMSGPREMFGDVHSVSRRDFEVVS